MNKKSININLSSFLPVRISLSEQILFAKHLAIMLKSGMSEVESLRIIQEQIKGSGLSRIMNKIIASVENGQFLSEALSQYKKTFGELFINIIKLGEISGTLPQNLEYLAAEIKKKYELKSKVKSALIYPVIILMATLGVTGALILFVLPKILPVFTSLNIQVPLTTRILIGFAYILNNYYLLIVAGIIAIIFGWIMLLKIPIVKYVATKSLLYIPIAGRISLDYNMANINRTLGLLLKSGVKIVEAIYATASTTTNVVYKKALLEAGEEVKKGEQIYSYLEKQKSIFPTTVVRMIQIGEKTGNLDSNLIYLSEFYESELNEKIKNLSNTMEPILMAVMGLLVGFVAVSIITPIYEITQNIHR